MTAACAVLFAAVCCAEEPLPWQVNSPLVQVQKTIYCESPAPAAAALVKVSYVGPGLEREELHAEEIIDDVPDSPRRRVSLDNGRTWSGFTPQPATLSHPVGVEVWEGPVSQVCDPRTGLLVQSWLRQINLGGLFHNFTYIRQSADLGASWSQPRQLVCEPGEPFDPTDPTRPAFLERNHGYSGSNILVHSNATLIHAVAHANAPGDGANDERPWRMASLCYIGRWQPSRGEYAWTAGNRVQVSPDVSSRGLMEPEVAELTDGRVLVIWRGSSTPQTPGHKLCSVSRDGGLTLSPPAELRYDDGTPFYSPSSYHRMIRHSVTGKLYWIGNISATPPSGNSPRFPLVIAEVDEKAPALRKTTVTAIDDRRPDQPEAIQFSNFSVFENRETHDLELYMTLYGESPGSVYTAHCYRYDLRLNP